MIATDIPSTLRRAGRVPRRAARDRPARRRCSRRSSRPRTVALTADDVGAPPPRPPSRRADAADAPVVPRGRRPTCSPPRRPRREPASRRAAPAGARARRRASTRLDAAERPLHLGRRRRARRGRRGAALAERLAAPVLTTYGAAGVLPPGASVPGRDAAARRAGRPAVGRGRPRDRDRLGPRRRADAELRAAAAAGAGRGQPRRRGRDQELPRRRACSRATPRTSTAALADRCRDAAVEPLAERLRGVRARGVPHARRARAALPRRDPLRACPTTASSSSTCASRATGSPASTRRRARAGCSSRSAGARSATPSRPRSAPRSPAPARRSSISGDGGFLFACGELATMAQEQIPLTAVIVDDGGYGMLRYDQDVHGDETLRRRPPHARLRRAGRRPSASAPRPSTGSTTRSARRSPGTSRDAEPSVLVARTPEPLVPPPNTSPNWYRRRR